MRDRAVLMLTSAAVFFFITIRFFMTSVDEHEKSTRFFRSHEIKQNLEADTDTSKPKCNLPRVCPQDHYAFRIRSGAANVVGPQICFDGKNIMSNILNNVGPGLNMVIINGLALCFILPAEQNAYMLVCLLLKYLIKYVTTTCNTESETGAIEKVGYINVITGKRADILASLKEIKPGKIILVASFINAATKMTRQMRNIFVDIGSSLIHSVRHRDNWVFAGKSGAKIKSNFEKQAVNDEKTNAFDGWPQTVEVGGCFPRNLNATQ